MLKVKRQELKFYVNYLDYIKLSTILKAALHPDKHNCPNGGYLVRSVYFDTLFDSAFYEKLEGIEKRKKYRLRIYGKENGLVKFEIKNKLNNSILKETAIIKKEDALKVLNQEYDRLLSYNDLTLNKIYCEFIKYKYHPVVLVDYEREAYTWPINNIRITFDKNLSRNTINLNMFDQQIIKERILDQNLVIMEIKFEHYIPEWITDIFRSVSFVNSAISKYCISRMEV